MKKTIKMAISLLCALVMLASTCVFADAPGGKPGGGGDTESTATYTYIEFGSYPQTEIVSQASDSGVFGKTWAAESDYIVDAELYDELVKASWDANGDATVNKVKYHRIKQSDATGVVAATSEDAPKHYNWSSSETYHYFKYEPIKWRVLKQDGNDIFLLSEIVLDTQKYHSIIPGSIPWANCTLRSWLNGYGSSSNAYKTDYTGKGFINTAFTAEEQLKIKTTDVKNNDSINAGTEGGNDTQDKIFLLSEDEVYGENATQYGFNSSYDKEDTARQAKSSAYAKAMGVEMGVGDDDLGNSFWWLRTPGSENGLTAYVRSSGSLDRGGQHANSGRRGVRPAMHISVEGLDGISDSSYFVSLTLKDNIDVNFSMTGLSDKFDTEKLVITVDDNTWTDYTLKDGVLSGVLKAVEPQDIGNDLHIVITYDGFPLKDFNYSVTDYCDSVFTKQTADEALETPTGQYDKLSYLCEALLNYGKYAADYINENKYGAGNYTESTVNKNHERKFGKYDFGTIAEKTVKGSAGEASLELGSTIKLKYFVKTDKTLANGDTDTQNFFVLNSSGEQIDPARVKFEKVENNEKYNYIVSIDLYASQLATSYTLKLKDVDTDTFCITYGVYNYCSEAQKQTDEEFTDALKILCRAIHNYGVAVQAYLA